MASTVLVIGEPATGKSTSIQNLNPEETFIINVLDKPLPFRGGRKHYIQKENGNYFSTDKKDKILQILSTINQRSDIKTIIIDDWQYTMGNEFMLRALEKGYNKFSEIGQIGWSIIIKCSELRRDIDCFILSHSQESNDGLKKCKTIGKMLENQITLEGMFTIILHSVMVDNQYKFLTQNDGKHLARSPIGLFETTYIDNDLQLVKDKMQSYFESDIPQ